jgi:carbohydrate-binding DOMON domain-containing protein
MSTQYRLVQSGKTASGGCSAGQGSSEPVAPRIYYKFCTFNTICKKKNYSAIKLMTLQLKNI